MPAERKTRSGNAATRHAQGKITEALILDACSTSFCTVSLESIVSPSTARTVLARQASFPCGQNGVFTHAGIHQPAAAAKMDAAESAPSKAH